MYIITCIVKPYFEKNIGKLEKDIKYKLKANDYIIITNGDIKVVLLKANVYQVINNIKMHVDCEYILYKNKFIR